MTRDPIQTFIDRWSPSGGAERANYVSFLNELCDVLDVPRPNPATPDAATEPDSFVKIMALCDCVNSVVRSS